MLTPRSLLRAPVLFCLLGLISLLAPALATASSAYGTAVEADEPLAYWHQVEGGEIPDETGNGFDIGSGVGKDVSASESSPIVGDTEPASIRFGAGTANNGIIAPLERSDLTNWSSGWAIDYWAKVDSASPRQNVMIIGNADGFSPIYNGWALVTDSSKYQFYFGHGHDESYWTGTGSADANTWHHFAVSVTPGSGKFYLDGTLVDDYTGTQPSVNSSAPFTFATYKGDSWPTGNWGPMQGNMSEIAIYNHALSVTAVEEHYDLGHAGFDVSCDPVEGEGDVALPTPRPVSCEASDERSLTFEVDSTDTTDDPLPAGLSLTSEGKVTGTPTDDILVPVTTTTTIKGTDESSHTARGHLTITIKPTIPEKFRPILRFDSDEPWRPLDVEQFLAEGDHYWCEDILFAPDPCSEIDSWEDLRLYDTSDSDLSHAYIDINGEGTSGGTDTWHSPTEACFLDEGYEDDEKLFDCDEGSATAIYYHPTEQPDPSPGLPGDQGYNFLDYWFFYRFNQGPLAGATDDHEGDWESVYVAVPKAEPTTFAYAVFAAHNGGPWRYLRGALICDSNESCGEEGSPEGERVNVFVAMGSHASYPQPCSSGCKQTESLASNVVDDENNHDGEDPWGANNDPEALRLFPSGKEWGPSPSSREESAWTDWPGLWGHSDDSIFESSGPNGPGTRGARWSEPWSAWECTDVYAPEGQDCEDMVASSLSPAWPELAAVGQSLAPVPVPPVVRTCLPWLGPEVQYVACNGQELANRMHEGTLNPQNAPSLPEAATAIGSAPGLIQVLGPALSPSDSVVVTHAMSLRGALLVRVLNGEHFEIRLLEPPTVRPGERREIPLSRARALDVSANVAAGAAL